MHAWWNRLKYWLPALAWMGIIFTASGDRDSYDRSSRIIAPFVRWLFPDLPEESVEAIVVSVRKCAHLAEYAILAVLFWFGLRRPARHSPRPWTWREPAVALIAVFLYAITDELHQTMVPSRHGAATDVLLDTLGGAIGLSILWMLGHLRKWW